MLEQTTKPFADILIHYFGLCYEGATGKPLTGAMKEELEGHVLYFAQAIVQEVRGEHEDMPLTQVERDRQEALEYGLRHGNQAF